ncbi:hypothetical protein ACPA54_36575 [Uniformispora flossi]|uniref:hypothetical protein n=1 Tax=Uniformispora flossi TaxID=3390723 RepID=UPI003C2B9CC1
MEGPGLTARERRLLAEIEHDLSEDRALAGALCRMRPPLRRLPSVYWHRLHVHPGWVLAAWLLAAVGLLGAARGTGNIVLVAVAAGMWFGCVATAFLWLFRACGWRMSRRRRRRDP